VAAHSRLREGGPVRFLKYFLAGLGLFMALLFLGVATAKLFAPSMVGLWVGRHAGFVIGVVTANPKPMELLGNAFAPFFYATGYLLWVFCWNRIRHLRMMRDESVSPRRA
jgi:hypothetical protein